VTTPSVDPWVAAADQMRARGLRWTSRRRAVVDVLSDASGHLTGAEIVERCRQRDHRTVPSTVYRTLDVLEELGLVRHGHGADGREEYHVRPADEHGHLYCEGCGRRWDLPGEDLAGLIAGLSTSRGFEVDVSHVAIVGRCAECAG
jgi:Fur family transcriptional regulator, ferric uptake regulator